MRVAKIFLIGDRSRGQLPFAAMARPRQHSDAVVAECQEWIAADAVDAIAASVGYEDPAFFRRLFKRMTAITPGRYRQRHQSIAQLDARGL